MVVWSASHYYVPPPPVTICHRAAAQCPGSVSGGVTSVTILQFSISIISAYHNKTLLCVGVQWLNSGITVSFIRNRCVIHCVANGPWFMSLRLLVTNYLLYVTDLIYSV